MAAKTERLLNLVVMLQRSSAWTTRAELRRTVPEYAASPSDDAFERMFERDKAELRELGLTIETGPDGAIGDELGYRIRAAEHQLPELTFDADDLTILALATRAWQTLALQQQARSAGQKLSALADGPGQPETPSIDIRLPEAGQWFSTVFDAITTRTVVRFRYRSASSATTEVRTLQPWQLVTRRGAWYLVGFDVDREAPRVFRTSRIVDDVVADGDPHAFERPPRDIVREHVAHLTEPEASSVATLKVVTGRGHGLRRAATSITTGDDGTDVLEVPYASDEALASQIVALGGAAVALQPPSLADAVRRHAGALSGAALAGADHGEGAR
jgi:predicted DNA-binding transcriptional regulator YafY